MDIKALYEIKRQGFLLGFIQNPKNFDPALAYAHQHRMAPFFHEEIMREHHGADPFEAAYRISADFMDKVYEYLDECDINEKLEDVAFYKLEDHFGGYKKHRIELIRTIEYARISGRWGDELYAAIAKDAPAEANHIDSSFEPKDVFFG